MFITGKFLQWTLWNKNIPIQNELNGKKRCCEIFWACAKQSFLLFHKKLGRHLIEFSCILLQPFSGVKNAKAYRSDDIEIFLRIENQL